MLRKLISFLFLFTVLSFSQNLPNPMYATGSAFNYRAVVTCTSAGCSLPPITTVATSVWQGMGKFKLSWTVDGSPTCAVTLDSLSNQAASRTVGGLIASQNCGTAGSFTMPSATFVNFFKLTPTITGTGSVTFTLTGYFN